MGGVVADDLIVEVSQSLARRRQGSVMLDVTVVPDVEHQHVKTLVADLNSGRLRPLSKHQVFSATTTGSAKLVAQSRASLSETRARSEAGHSTTPGAETESSLGGVIALVASVVGTAVAVVAILAVVIRRKALAKDAENDAALRRLVVMDGSGSGPMLCDFIGGSAQIQTQGRAMPMPSGVSARPGRRQRGGSKLMDTLTT